MTFPSDRPEQVAEKAVEVKGEGKHSQIEPEMPVLLVRFAFCLVGASFSATCEIDPPAWHGLC